MHTNVWINTHIVKSKLFILFESFGKEFKPLILNQSVLRKMVWLDRSLRVHYNVGFGPSLVQVSGLNANWFPQGPNG